MTSIEIKLEGANTTVQRVFGSDSCAPTNIESLTDLISKQIWDFYNYTGEMPSDISIEVKDFTEKQTTSGYTSLF